MPAPSAPTAGPTPAVPDRLVELAESWSSPFRWETLLRRYAELTRDREVIREMQAARRLGDEFADLTAFIVREHRELAEAGERLYLELQAELAELDALTRSHAPDLLGCTLGYIGVAADMAAVERRVRDMRTLTGMLLARRASSPPPGFAPAAPAPSPDTAPAATDAPCSAGEATGANDRAGKRSPDERNADVLRWLTLNAVNDPMAVTIRDVSAGTGMSVGSVAKTPAWREFQDRRKATARGEVRFGIMSFRDLNLLTAGWEPDPAALAAARDESESVWAEVLGLAGTPAEREKLAALPDDDRLDLIREYLAQKRDDSPVVRGGHEYTRAGCWDLMTDRRLARECRERRRAA